MNFSLPPKIITQKWLISLLIFVPFIFPGKYPSGNEKAMFSFNSRAALGPVAGVRPVSPLTRIIDSGQDVFSPPAPPTSAPQTSPALARFITRVADGQAKVVRGVYAAGILALQVIQQPDKDWTYVSEVQGNATEFQNAANNGVIGLLAHNYLSGRLFYNLKSGDQIGIVYGDSLVKYYRVSGSYQYQKLDPNDLSSKLVDLSNGATVTSGQVFEKFYSGGDHVTLQTCLEKNGISTWGLYFVVAQPVSPGN
jgi:hypothetical protein